jgi:nucleotide-binding universal stress UspA family protein
MTTALVCLDGYRPGAVLDVARATLAPSMTWLLLHVSDTRPAQEAAHAFGRLLGHGPGRKRAADRVDHVVAWNEADVQAAAEEWLVAAGREAEVVTVRGQPEREIVRVAEERGVHLIVLGGGRGHPGRYPGPGPYPLSPVARFVVDHARTDVLLLRRYVAEVDRRA